MTGKKARPLGHFLVRKYPKSAPSDDALADPSVLPIGLSTGLSTQTPLAPVENLRDIREGDQKGSGEDDRDAG